MGCVKLISWTFKITIIESGCYNYCGDEKNILPVTFV